MMLFLTSLIYGVNAQSNAWVCEDECVKQKNGQICGVTNHFSLSDDETETMTVHAIIDVTYQNSARVIPNEGGEGATADIAVSELTDFVSPLFAVNIYSSETIEIVDVINIPGGGMVCAGNFSGALSTDGNFDDLAEGQSDSFVLEYNAAGNVVWGTKLGGALNDNLQKMAINEGGDIFLAGQFSLDDYNNYLDHEFYGTEVNPEQPLDIIIKLDNTGMTQWATAVGQSTAGGFQVLEPNGNTGGVVMSLEENEASNLAADNPIFQAPAGAQTNILASINPGGELSMKDMHVSGDGSTFITGSVRGPVDFDLTPEFQIFESGVGRDLFFVKYDSNGQLVDPRLIDWENGDD